MLRSAYSMVWVFAGGDAPCVLASGRLSAVGSLVGLLVQLQRIKVPGVLVTVGLAHESPAAAPLQDASALLGGRGLQVCQDPLVRMHISLSGHAKREDLIMHSIDALVALACYWRLGLDRVHALKGCASPQS